MEKEIKKVKTVTPKGNSEEAAGAPIKTAPVKTAPVKATAKTITVELPAAAPALTIDAAVFEESHEKEASEYEYRDITRSRTIDGTMLSDDRFKNANKKKKKAVIKSNLSLAERYTPDITRGLSNEQVQARQNDGYVNLTGRKTGKTYGAIFFSNIFTFFNMLTFIVAAALIVVRASFSQLFFLVIIFLNIGVGIFQEIRSKRAVDKLKLINAPTAIVIRNGEKVAIPVGEIVLDDILFFEAGKQICTDAIVIKGDLEVNESMLTGESDAMKKTVGSELFSGSFVSSGNCFARADKVGAANYVETLTSYAKRYRKPKSELNNAIKLIIKIVSIFIVPITIAMLFNNYRNFSETLGTGWDAWRQNVISVSGAIIGMIPAGMFLLTSTALFVSVAKLAKRKILVQDLYCIEMLARVNVLCLDKTGTITDGTMQVNNIIEIKGGESPYPLKDIIGSMLTATEDNNQTARALANYFGYSQSLKAVKSLPFSSQRKLSAVTFEGIGTYMLGAPEFVLKDVGVRIEKVINDSAANGYRVLCLAHSPSEIVGDKLPAVRRPLCLIVIEDHIREDAAATIQWFRENNVAVRVISGDNPVTVSEVARRVGVANAELYVSLDGLSNQEVIEAAEKYTVFGRVSPEQKLLIIKALKAKGHTVAMTGDGVNDILAMREADCSVSIASGAEAARNVSHLVLQDSSFTSMPDVVREGRQVVNNIQKSSSLFLMKTLMSILLSIIFLIMPTLSTSVFKQYPYSTDNLLLFELVIIALPSFVLALQKNDNIIKGKFISNVIGRCVPGGLTLVISTMAIYFYNTYLANAAIAAGGEPSMSLYKTMLVMTLALTGIMLLGKIAEPLDAVRATLLGGVILLFLLAISFLPPSIFGIAHNIMGFQDYLFMITVALGSYVVVSGLMKVMRAMKILN